MSLKMTREEREAFLADLHVGVVSIGRQGKAPLTAPIWYDYEPGGKVWMIAGTDSLKAKALVETDDISLVAQAEAPPAFTWSDAQLIPQSDRIGKRRAWQLLNALRGQHLAQPGSAAQPPHVNLTNGRLFSWKLWLCNLGPLAQDTFGPGISTIHLEVNQGPIITMVVTRSDDTVATLSLAQRAFSDGTHAHYTELTVSE